MRKQHDSYQAYFGDKLETPDKIRKWLFAGAFHQFNLTAEKVKNGSISREEESLLKAIDINSHMYWEIKQLQLRYLAHIEQNIGALHNLMPHFKALSDLPVDDKAKGSVKGQKRHSSDDYDNPDLTLDPDSLFVAQPFPVGRDPCGYGDFECG